jgi:hypothetical protein
MPGEAVGPLLGCEPVYDDVDVDEQLKHADV